MKRRIFSGMQPSGELHIGNWLGALRQWVELSANDEYDSIFCVVDAHAVTVDYDPKAFRARILEAAMGYLAAGVDPSRSAVFVQSDVREHMELAWYLSCCTQMGELHRMTQFKDKSEQHKHNVNAGLFTYPVLMAADVLLYRASLVPVGDDQVQHLELAREIARRFNQRYKKKVFPEPAAKLSKAPRIMGLDGHSKMAKSRGNTIALCDGDKAVWNKLKGAFTDPQRLRREDPGRPEVCNIFTMHTALQSTDSVDRIAEGCRAASIGCGDCKKELHERLMEELGPVQDRLADLRTRPDDVWDILRNGASKCRVWAQQTMEDVRRCMAMGTP
ncbi:MAG: tryptophan--tRNA ligase [Polyangiaceae bacterium]|nr:tryptophan--tRNA ligase [Polyangiaceae bacterium]